MNREEKVVPFLEMAGVEHGVQPEKVGLNLRELAIALIFEESCVELAEASNTEDKLHQLCQDYIVKYQNSQAVKGIDKVKQLDALADAQYVLSWAINVLGHAAVFEAAYNEVCRSNNSKACDDRIVAEATADNAGVECVIYERPDGSYVVKRKSDGKLIKSIEYSPADFEQFFKKE